MSLHMGVAEHRCATELTSRPNRLFYFPMAIIRAGYWTRFTGRLQKICQNGVYHVTGCEFCKYP
jgi:hypothetical protein